MGDGPLDENVIISSLHSYEKYELFKCAKIGSLLPENYALYLVILVYK